MYDRDFVHKLLETMNHHPQSTAADQEGEGFADFADSFDSFFCGGYPCDTILGLCLVVRARY